MEEAPKAWIISVGNELLIGRIVNTNASWLGEKLTLLGFNVQRMITVPDSLEDIAEEVGRGARRARLVITTGGLGPTYDDMTLAGVAKAFGLPLELNSEALHMVEEFYSRRGLPLTEDRKKMAMLPKGAVPLRNSVGAAPGSWLEIGDSIIVSLPGVPAEMKAIFEEEVVPRLKRLVPNHIVVECSVVVRGVPESSIAPFLKRLAKEYTKAYIKSHPKGHELEAPLLDIRVFVGGEGEEIIKLAERIASLIEEEALRLGGRIERRYCEKKSD